MLAGDLNEFTLRDVFQLLALTRKSGALRVSHGDAEGRVYFADGDVYFAVADGRRLPLGARLVASGHLGPDRLQELLRERRGDSAVRIAADLLASGDVDDAVLAEFVRDQIHDALFALLRLDSGAFEFDSTAGLEWPGARVPATEALEEAHRRVDEWEGLATELPPGDAVLALAPNPPGESQLALTREQWQLMTLVDGKRTLSEVVGLSGKGEFGGGRLVAEMVSTGLVEAHSRPGEGGLADLLAARHALRQLEEVALDAGDTASSPAGPSLSDADEETADSQDPGTESEDPADVADEAAFDAGGGDAPGSAPSQDSAAAAEDAPGSEPDRGQVALLAPASSEDAESTLSGLIEADPGDLAQHVEDPGQEHPEPTVAADQRDASEVDADADAHDDVEVEAEAEVDADADAHGDVEVEAEVDAGPKAEATDTAAQERRLDRAQVARELAALGLDDEQGAPTPSRARASGNGQAARAGASAGAPAAAGEVSQLSRDEDVTRGLLLRLIDGVKGA